MRVLIKTREELLDTPNATLCSDNRITHTETGYHMSVYKQQEICGKVMFCFNSFPDLVTQPRNTKWRVEGWMIKEVLIE